MPFMDSSRSLNGCATGCAGVGRSCSEEAGGRFDPLEKDVRPSVPRPPVELHHNKSMVVMQTAGYGLLALRRKREEPPHGAAWCPRRQLQTRSGPRHSVSRTPRRTQARFASGLSCHAASPEKVKEQQREGQGPTSASAARRR